MIDTVRTLGRKPQRNAAAERAAHDVTRTADDLVDELAHEFREPPHRLDRAVRDRAVEPGHDRNVQRKGLRKRLQDARPAHAPRRVQIDDRPPFAGNEIRQLSAGEGNLARLCLHRDFFQRSRTCGCTRSRKSSMPRRITSSGSVPTFTVKLKTPWPNSEWMRLICFTTVSGLPQSTVPRSMASSKVRVRRLSRRL